MALAAIPGINFAIDGLFGWLLVGLIAGFLASAVVRARGFGCIGNIVVGLLGAVIGGYLASLLNFTGTYHFWGTVLISFIGAVILLIILGALTGGRSRSR
jgi:uncharacterized membrane protein YeaQ/YmgE (transglycosylase-associated protein family)